MSKVADAAHKIVVASLVAYSAYGLYHIGATSTGIVSRYVDRHNEAPAAASGQQTTSGDATSTTAAGEK